MAPSELSFNPAVDEHLPRPKSRDRPSSGSGGPLGSHPTRDSIDVEDPRPDVVVDEENVPPVPPIPSGIEGVRVSSVVDYHSHNHAATLPRPATGSRKSLKSRGGGGGGGSNERAVSSSAAAGTGGMWGAEAAPAMDLQALLKGIDSHAPEKSLGTFSAPPY
jgi:hypothetical protein